MKKKTEINQDKPVEAVSDNKLRFFALSMKRIENLSQRFNERYDSVIDDSKVPESHDYIQNHLRFGNGE